MKNFVFGFATSLLIILVLHYAGLLPKSTVSETLYVEVEPDEVKVGQESKDESKESDEGKVDQESKDESKESDEGKVDQESKDESKESKEVNQPKVTIMVPINLEDYLSEMTRYLQEGRENPVDNFEFVEKEITVEIDYYDLMKLAVSEASDQGLIGGGPKRARVKYLELRNGVSYIVLDIDEDGWSGASTSTDRIRPLIEKTLLRFDEVDEVVFDYSDVSKANLRLEG